MSPPPGGGGSPDLTDVIFQQAQMVFFAIPGAGPGLAAITSILGAINSSVGGSRQTYSIEQAIDDLGTYIINTMKSMASDDNLNTINGWQNKRAQIQSDTRLWATTGDAAIATADEAFFLNLPDYTKMWATFGDVATPDTGDPATTTSTTSSTGTASSTSDTPPAPANAARVTDLELYITARVSYHSLATALLMLLARAEGGVTDDWLKVGSPVRTRLEESLEAAVAHVDPIATFLAAASTSTVTQAKALTASITDPVARNVAFTQQLRTLRHAAFLDVTTAKKITWYASIADTFRQTLANLKKSPLPAKQGGQTSGPAQGGGGLGPRLPKTARFLFETSATGGWVDVVANPTVAAGYVATQNAGSAKPGLFYEIGGLGVNGIFTTQLTAAGQLASAQAAITTAYDAEFGTGSFAADGAANPTRQDRLTSFLIPLSPAAPVEDRIVAMVYSAAPELSGTIVDTGAYQQIYADALDAIAAWNAKHPTIENFRVVMLGTGINAGTPSPALNQQAAGLIVDAVIAALKAKPSLQTLNILVNTNDTVGGGATERDAFTAAAKAKGVTPTRAGFDIAWT